MCIHAVHRLERGGSASSTAEVAALDAVAAREWEQPDAAGASLEGMQRQLEAEERAQASRQQPQQQLKEGQPAAEQQGGASGAGSNGSGSRGVRSNVVKVIGLYPFLQGTSWGALPVSLGRCRPGSQLWAAASGSVSCQWARKLKQALESSWLMIS